MEFTIISREADTVHDALSIEKNRARMLLEILKNTALDLANHYSIGMHIEKVSKYVGNPNELAYICYSIGKFTGYQDCTRDMVISAIEKEIVDREMRINLN
jgi:hypothetical protein